MLNLYFFCNIFCILGVNLSQKWTKSVHSKTKFFRKNSNFSKDCWSSVFISINTTSAQKLHQNWTIFGGVRIKKHSQNELDIDADLVRKTSKICNLTTFHLAKTCGGIHGASENANMKKTIFLHFFRRS